MNTPLQTPTHGHTSCSGAQSEAEVELVLQATLIVSLSLRQLSKKTNKTAQTRRHMGIESNNQ